MRHAPCAPGHSQAIDDETGQPEPGSCGDLLVAAWVEPAAEKGEGQQQDRRGAAGGRGACGGFASTGTRLRDTYGTRTRVRPCCRAHGAAPHHLRFCTVCLYLAALTLGPLPPSLSLLPSSCSSARRQRGALHAVAAGRRHRRGRAGGGHQQPVSPLRHQEYAAGGRSGRESRVLEGGETV